LAGACCETFPLNEDTGVAGPRSVTFGLVVVACYAGNVTVSAVSAAWLLRHRIVHWSGGAMDDADVVVVGAGPTGLMLATELGLAGVRTVVLERQPQLRDTAKANGFSGQILDLLRYRGLLERFEAASSGPAHPAPAVPFGGLRVDLGRLADSPLTVLGLPQTRLERLLDERARELGAEVRRGHEMVGLSQDDGSVTVELHGPHGSDQLRAAYLVGCDGPRSRVRALAGIGFTGTTYPEVNRIAEVTLHDSAALRPTGELEVPALGPLRPGITRTEHGVFAFGPLRRGVVLLQTTEDRAGDLDEEAPMTVTEFQESVRRVLGTALPLGKVTRLSRYTFQARQADHYRAGRVLLAGDAAHQFPATGVGINVGMTDAVNLAWELAANIHGWAPSGLLDTYHRERQHAAVRTMLQTQAQAELRRGQGPAADALRDLFLELCADDQPARRLAALIAGNDVRYPTSGPEQHPLAGTFMSNLALHTAAGITSLAELLHAGRPVLLDLADRPALRHTAQPWRSRVEIHAAAAGRPPADALLIRPDAYIAWAARSDEDDATAAAGLGEALSTWFGTA
jgi:2-polyprenyl-6-methoxyphenol hydroxylase-like FAD-dependent oxidoreductase